MPAWKSRALAAVCSDVCAFLDGVLQTGSRVSRYERTGNKEAIHFSQVFSMIRVKCLEDEVARLKGENSTLRTSLMHQQQGHKRQLDTELDGLKEKVRKVEEVTDRVATNETAVGKLKTTIQRITPRFIKTKSNIRGKSPPPPEEPVDSPAKWRQRLLLVTKCQRLTDHCKIVCDTCNYNYRGRAVRLSAHMAHLKNKHQGFTPADVSPQNEYLKYIPRLIEKGEEEKERERLQNIKSTRDKERSEREARLERLRRARERRSKASEGRS